MAADLYGLTPDDRLGGHSPLHFDMSTFDYFSAMLAGAATVIVPEPYSRLPASLSQLVETERLTVWYSAPYAIVLLVEKGVLASRDIASLRWVIFGGEPMSPKHLEALRAHAPAVRFSNSYGPAEVNQCTVFHLPAGPVADTPIPLGHACPHTRALIVDAVGEPAEEGELLIATPAMMRGYWGRPDLDARGFHDDAAGTRWYRTGDVVRRDADGLLHFLGRRDRQVKVRGHRVELDEVEHALAGCPGVSEAAALLRPGDAATVEGFVTLSGDDPPASDAIRRFAAGRLPAYAVPASVTVLAGFPRTGSGKIDRPALAAAQFGRQDP
jgi:acyl-coenzyme A synthetase/AMP-(fatty) acid ligase